MSLPQIPEIFVDNTDRNRTSPFAFTGNRFEFRAVGSPANCAGAMTTLNAAVAEQLVEFKAAVDKEMAAGKTMTVAVMDVLKPIIASIIDVVCFDGNGYSDEWVKEAIKRGLDVERCVPKMFLSFTSPSSLEMFTKTKVYTAKELEARNEVKWEMYTKKVQIEARVLGRMAVNHIIPTAIEYQSKLLDNIKSMKEIDGVGHRVVASGEAFKVPTLVTPESMQLMEEIKDLAPLHNPAAIVGVNACLSQMPDTPMVLVFDTGFHLTMPDYAYMYAVDYEHYQKYKIRRYGAHGHGVAALRQAVAAFPRLRA